MGEQHAIAKTAFWIVSILCVILLALHVLASTQVTQYDSTDLGLLTKLPVTFWIGLSYLGVLLYVSRESKRRTIIVALLITFYLIAIPVLIRENKAEVLWISYGRASFSEQILSEGHIDLSTLDPWDLRNWPGFFFIAAILSSSTGLPATVLADYFPLLTIALLGIGTYSILKLRLNPLHSSLGALWFMGSFWTRQHYFSPQAIAYMMYFAIFLLLAKLFFTKKQSIAYPLSIIVLFTGVVASHFLTSFMIVAGVIAVYGSSKILPQKAKMPVFYSFATCILLACIFLFYQTLVIQRSFSNIIMILFGEFKEEAHISTISQARLAGSTSYQLELVGNYSLTIINVVIAILAILTLVLGLLYHKKEAKNDVFWITWIILAGILGVTINYGGEAIERAFMFMLVPICYFAIKFLGKKPRILILVLMVLLFIHIPAIYTSEVRLYVPTTELKGTTFYVKYTPSTASLFYEPIAPFLPAGVHKGIRLSITVLAGIHSLPSQEFVDETTGKAEFIISSNLQKNYYLYYLGVDPLEHLNLDDHYNRIYDNEGFQIYTRIDT